MSVAFVQELELSVLSSNITEQFQVWAGVVFPEPRVETRVWVPLEMLETEVRRLDWCSDPFHHFTYAVNVLPESGSLGVAQHSRSWVVRFVLEVVFNRIEWTVGAVFDDVFTVTCQTSDQFPVVVPLYPITLQ